MKKNFYEKIFKNLDNKVMKMDEFSSVLALL